MNALKYSPAKLFVLLFTVAVLQSCSPADPGTWKNGQISGSERELFHKLNDQLFDALKTNTVRDVESMMSASLLTDDSYRRTIELISLQTKQGSYSLLDEYYLVSNKADTPHSLTTKATDGTNYKFYCATVTRETYVAFMVPKTKGDKYLVTAVYCKYDYGWRLNDLELQPYTITGKTSPQLFDKAQAQYKKGYVVDAFISMALADKCSRPNTLWQYPYDEQMTAFNGLLGDAISRYNYPLVLTQVASRPKIFAVTHLTTDEGVFPSIDYVSAINIKDTLALEKEKEQMKNTIGKIFPGIDKDKKYIYFTAFDKKPGSKVNAAFFNMTGKLTPAPAISH